jgi:hypothetical protein
MGPVTLKFDENRQTGIETKEIRVVLKPRCETIVKLPTTSRELETGLISKTEISPGVIIAATVTAVREGACLTSVVNLNGSEVTVTLPAIKLEQCETESRHVGTINTRGDVAVGDRSRELGSNIRTDHMNDEERRSLLRICEDYHDIFHLPGDRLTTTTEIEHAIPTPGVDPCRGIATGSIERRT